MYVYKNGGLTGVIFVFIYKVINIFTSLIILRIQKIECSEINKNLLGKLGNYNGRFLNRDEIYEFGLDSENDLPKSFVDYALEKEDECFAIQDGSVLANYCWCTKKPTIINEELVFKFKSEYYYRYRGFTRIPYRGKRLHAINNAESLKVFTERGVKGFVTYVEANNFTSYKSTQRMNYTLVGNAYILGRGKRTKIWLSGRCREEGFDVIRKSETEDKEGRKTA